MSYPLFATCFIPRGGRFHDEDRPEHDGLDLTARDINNPPMVPAADSGVVTYANKGPGAFGTQESIVIVQHDGYWSSYGHLAHGSLVVRAGQRVAKHQDLGRMGFSGYTIPPDKRATHTHICMGTVWKGSITASNPKFDPLGKLQGGSNDMTIFVRSIQPHRVKLKTPVMMYDFEKNQALWHSGFEFTVTGKTNIVHGSTFYLPEDRMHSGEPFGFKEEHIYEGSVTPIDSPPGVDPLILEKANLYDEIKKITDRR
jgi:hypothetical protein